MNLNTHLHPPHKGGVHHRWWRLWFVYDEGINPFDVTYYNLVTKPTKRQVRKLRKQFKAT